MIEIQLEILFFEDICFLLNVKSINFFLNILALMIFNFHVSIKVDCSYFFLAEALHFEMTQFLLAWQYYLFFSNLLLPYFQKLLASNYLSFY